MRIREEYIFYQKTLSDTDTVREKLNISDPITALVVELKAVNGSTDAKNKEIHEDVSKVGVVDGGTDISVLSMTDWLGVSTLFEKDYPRCVLTEKGGQTQVERFIIPFGRYIGDDEYYFDPNLYDNPMFRLEMSLNIASSGGFQSGSAKLTVIALIMEGLRGAKRGVMKYKQVASFTSGTSGDYPVVIPRDAVLRDILMFARLSGYRPDEVISKVKIDCDTGKFIPVEAYTNDLIDKQIKECGRVKITKQLMAGEGDLKYLNLYVTEGGNARCSADLTFAQIAGTYGNKIKIKGAKLTTSPSVATLPSDSDVYVEVYGQCPSGVVSCLRGKKDEPDVYFDPTPYKGITMYLTQAAAGNISVVVNQVADR